MKAFKVMHNVAGRKGIKSDWEIVLVEDEKDLEKALEEKSTIDFKAGDESSKIAIKKEIPLSKVKMGDLSITEYLLVQKNI